MEVATDTLKNYKWIGWSCRWAPDSMMRAILKVSIIFFSIASYGQNKDSLIHWLKESSISLQTTSPDSNLNRFPTGFFNGKRVILAGEATHGTSEFAQIKHRLFRYLVENYNFKYFLVEADFATSLAIDKYVCYSIGEPKKLLADLRFFHIANQDGLNLIKWMNQYNSDKEDGDKIRFIGIDCQQSTTALELLKEYFKEYNHTFYAKIKGYTVKTPTLRFGAETLAEDSIRVIERELATNKSYYIQNSSRKQWSLMVKLSEILEQSFQINNSGGNGYSLREHYIVELAEWILRNNNDTFENNMSDGNKGFVWAHNTHVNYTVITNRGTGKTTLSLGAALREKFKDGIYSIGMDFNKGEFYAKKFQKGSVVGEFFTVENAPVNTFSYLLSQTEYPVLFLDFQKMENSELRNYLSETRVKYRNVTAVFNYAYPMDMRFKNHILPQRFDGFIFINDSSPIILLDDDL